MKSKQTKKISVAIDTTFMDRRTAMGTAVFIRELVERLDAYKNELDITLVHREAIPEDALYKEYNEVIMKRIPLPKGSRAASELWYFLTARKRFDVYYFAYAKLPFYFFFAPGRKIMSMQYDGGPATAGFDVGGTVQRLQKWSRPLLRRYVDAFIATSYFGKRGLVEAQGLSEKKVHVLYGGSDKIFKPIPKTEAWQFIEKEYGIKPGPLIVGSGRLDPHKNVLRLVEAFGILKKQYALPHRLIVTGGVHMPEYSQKVLARIKELDLEKDCLILRVREFGEMPYFYSAADAFVFPSLYEGFGLPLVEAMSCGTPTIAGRIPTFLETGGEATAFFDPLQPEDMARTIYKVITDDAYRKDLIVRGQGRAKKFSWDTYASGTADIIKALGAK